MGQLSASEAYRSHGASAMRSPTSDSKTKVNRAEWPDGVAQAVVHCVPAMPVIGQPESPFAGSGMAGPAQSGQVTSCDIDPWSPAHGAGGAVAPATGVYAATSNASKSARERRMCRR